MCRKACKDRAEDRRRDDLARALTEEDAGDRATAKLQDRNYKPGGPLLNDASFERRRSSKGKQKTISSNRADWAHRGFMQMITVVTGIRSMPVMRIV